MNRIIPWQKLTKMRHQIQKNALVLAVALFSLGLPFAEVSGTMPSQMSLNGEWKFSIHWRPLKKVPVPSTYLPVGGAQLERDFTLPDSLGGRRALLRFDGIVMTGQVTINGVKVGQYGPYAPFTIDITERTQPGANHLAVDLTDIDGFEPWGRAWVTAFPRYGGIIRDVTLELKSPIYIENARLDYTLTKNYTGAECNLKVWLMNTRPVTETVGLTAVLGNGKQGRTLKSSVDAQPGSSVHRFEFSLDPIKLWTPDSPELYDLELILRRSHEEADRFTSLTGFKELVAQGRDFYLNGKKFFLKGIFRHDIYGAQGHTLTRSQMEAEIADIKSLGCNFLRLGHYPQHAYIAELAARHGLLISEEPPVFGQDQKNSKVVEGAKFCLGGAIRRDWNNPAAAFWIIANESGTDPQYMKEMVAFVRSLDPARLVTIVDNTKLDERNVPWKAFREAGIQFICQNAYGSAFDGYYAKLEQMLPDDMPFVISEWGGPSNVYSQVLREGKYYLDHSNLVRNDGPRIAGISFWEYQDIPMSRWTEEGVLHWSLVDMDRQPYESYYALKTLYTGKQVLPPRGRLLVSNKSELLPRSLAPEKMERYVGYEMIDLSKSINSDRVIKDLKAVSPLAYPEELSLGNVAIGGLPFRLEHQVVALSQATPHVRISLRRAASELFFLGHVCYNSIATKPPNVLPEIPYLYEGFPNVEAPVPFKAYPQAGEFGEAVGEYVLIYEDGEREVIPLQNGIHFADYRLFYGLSPIDAIAVATERVLNYKGDYGTKSYQMRLFSYRPKRPSKKISDLEFNLTSSAYVPLLAALTARIYESD